MACNSEDLEVCSKKFNRGSQRLNQIPEDILYNNNLQEAINFALPKNYNFEIEKILWRIRQLEVKHVGLQFPEGLLIFASSICNILIDFSLHPVEVSILGDVTYGACCIDDLTARAIDVDFLVHFGHSCLVAIDQTILKCLYVFVDIAFEYDPLIKTVIANFPIKDGYSSLNTENIILHNHTELVEDVKYDICPRICLMGTIQYTSVVHAVKISLQKYYGSDNVFVPQELPLTAGEVLGCTSPDVVSGQTNPPNLLIFIADGRFHLESAMIHNPTIPAFRYDPFTKIMLREKYDHDSLHRNRTTAIEIAKHANSVGLILGTLGRQGSVGIFERLEKMLKDRNIKTTLFLMSEIMPARIERLAEKLQVGCPRLSIDWGHFFEKTVLLTPYEAFVAFNDEPYKTIYPMDYYSNQGGPWTNYKQEHRSGTTAPVNSLEQIETRRNLIRKRAEERRKQNLMK